MIRKSLSSNLIRGWIPVSEKIMLLQNSRTLKVQSETIARSPRPVFAARRIELQRRQGGAIGGLDAGFLRAHLVERDVDPAHLLDAPAHQRRRSSKAQRQGDYGVHLSNSDL